MSGTGNYLGVITPTEIDQLQKSISAEALHPLIALAKASKPHDIATNTENAARSILRKDQNWLTKLKPRLLGTSDFTNSSSALGELRAYGMLLDTAMAVSPNPGVPGKKVIPEFEVNAGDGAVIVEVHSRQLDPVQARAITQHRKIHRAEHKIAVEEAMKAGEKGVITSSAIGVIPLGAPDPRKPGDSVLTNSISRICGIKKEEKQIDPESLLSCGWTCRTRRYGASLCQNRSSCPYSANSGAKGWTRARSGLRCTAAKATR